MKMRTRMLVAAGITAAVVGPASASVAGQDIAWTWNSGDRDVRGQFLSDGDNYRGEEINGNGYINWSASGSGSGRWYVPGAANGSIYTLNLDFAEGRSVSMKVCEEKGGLPDDCSSTKYGVS